VGIYGVIEKSEQGWENAESTLRTVAAALSGAGMTVHVASALVGDDATAAEAGQELAGCDPDVLLAVPICWSFDNLTLTVLRYVSRPLAILAIPGIRAGSLVAAQQMGSLLTDLDIQHVVSYGDPAQAETYESILAYARAAAAKRRLAMGKVGSVGRRTPGMTPVAFDEVELTRLFGVQVVSCGWEEVESLAASLPAAAVEARRAELVSGAGSVRSADQALDDSTRLFLALRDWAQREGLLALSVGCYPHYAGRVCVACGLLGDERVPVGCEGDLNSALAMFLLQSFTGKAAHFGEMLEVDAEDNSIVSSHCGCAPPSLAVEPSAVTVAPVRIWERGACFRFPAQAGPATLVNLVGRRGTYRLCAVEGEAVASGMVFEGNPVKFVPQAPVGELLEMIGEHGFGHHWMMGYGHVAAELEAFCRISVIKGVFS
jgi:L-fucose isomerase-like protein